MDTPQFVQEGNPNKHGSEVSIDVVNQWMRQQPWYQSQMKQWGQDPGHPTLSKQQSKAVVQMAQQQGVQVPDDTEIDDHGNFNPKGHKLRNTLIVAGIAGATIATMGAAGVFAGAGGVAGGATGATGAATGAAAGGATAAGTGVAGAGLGAGAGIAGAGVPAGFAAAPLASTSLATGAAGIGLGAGAGLPAGTAGLAAGGASAGSILGGAGKVMDAAEPILGNMSKAAQDSNRNRDNTAALNENAKLARDKFALDAPSTRMGQSVRASLIKNAMPSRANWGGPGSGLKGQVTNFSGAATNGLSSLDPRTRDLADDVMTRDLQNQLNGGDDDMPFLDQVGKESTSDKLLGGASTGMSILQGIRKAYGR